MAVELASGYVSLVPSTKGFGAALDKQIGPEVDKAARDAGSRAGDGFTSSFGAGLGKIATVAATAFAGLKIGGFVKDSIGAASDLNETLSKVGVVLGQDVLPQVDAFASGAAAAFGQSRQQALDAAATFGVFGKSAGLTGKPLADFSTQMTGLASDLASFSNTSPEDAIVAISAALRGESEPIRQYGVLLDEATLQQRALKLGIVTTTKQALTPQQRVLAAQAEILAQTTDAQGDFARTSGGLANQQRILAAQLQNVKSVLGQAFLPAALRVVKFLNTSAVPAVLGFINAFQGKFEPKLLGVGFIGKFESAGVKLRGAFDKIIDGVRIFKKELDPATVTTKGFDNLNDVFAHLGDFVGKARDFGKNAIQAFIDGFTGQTVDADGFLGTIRNIGDKVRDLVTFFKDDLPAAIKAFTDGFTNGSDTIDKDAKFKALSDLGDTVKSVVDTIKDNKDVFIPLAEALSGLGAALLVISKVSPVFGVLQSGVSGLGTVFSAVTSPLGLILIGLAALAAAVVFLYEKFPPFRKAVDSVAKTFEDKGLGAAVDDAGTQFTGLWDVVKPALVGFLHDAIAWFQENGPIILKELGKALAGGISFLFDEFLVPLGTWITQTGLPWLKDKFTTEWGPAFVDWITETAIPQTLGKLPEFVDAITQWIKDHKDQIAAATGVLADAVVDWIENTAIPALQQRLPEIIAVLVQFFVQNIGPLGRQIGSLLMDVFFETIIEKLPDLALKIPGELAILGLAMLGGIIAGIIGPDGTAKLEEIATNIIAFVSGLPARIKDAAVGMWDGLYDAFKGAINLIIRAWNGLDFTLPEIDTHIPGIGKVGGFTLGTPDIPELAGGGVFNSPFTGMLKLAETPAARPEIVTPQKLLAQTFRKELATVGAGGGGGVQFGDIVVNGAQASPSSIADAVFAKAGWLHFTGRREL